VGRFLSEGSDPNVESTNGQTALIAATVSEDPLVIMRLLRAVADPNQVDDLGWAPLHHAVKADRARFREGFAYLARAL
jgi:ankyrin repeat protein